MKNSDSFNSMEYDLTANLFGGVHINYRGKTVSNFATKKVLGLFCFLIDNPEHSVARDKLMSIFWGESPESQARYNLRYALWNIRKLLKEQGDEVDPLITTRDSCQINPEFQYITDIALFLQEVSEQNKEKRLEALQNAVNLYRGPYLDGFILRNLPEWEDWLFQRREKLHHHFTAAAVELGNRYLAIDKPEQAVHVFMRTLAVASDLEPAHEGLIRAYADQGKVAAALRHYNTYAETMQREFDASPRQEIADLADRLRQGEYVKSAQDTELTSLIGQAEQPDIPTQTLIQPFVTPVQDSTEQPTVEELTDFEPHPAEFIGRKHELDELNRLIGEVASGRGYVLIISGEMGIGKTRLFQEILRLTPDSFFIGLGESQQIRSGQPLEELVQVLENISRDQRVPQELQDDLKAIYREQERHIEAEDGDETSESTLLEAIRRWLVKLAKQTPVLVALDDMHWAGQTVLNFFSALAQDVKRLPIFLVGIFRAYELQSEDAIAASLISIARTGRLKRFELSSLSSEETKRLISSKVSRLTEILREHDLERLYRFSSGIPLYAIELAHFLDEGKIEVLGSPVLEDRPDFSLKTENQIVPPLMIRITNLRLSKLPEHYVNLLKITSLLLGKFSLELAVDLSGMDLDDLEDMLVDLEHRNFLHHEETGNRLTFSYNHQMVKLSLSETIPHLERRRLFSRIIKAVENSGEEISTDAQAYYLYNGGEHLAAIPSLLASSNLWLGYGDRLRGLQYSKIAYKVAIDHISDDPDTMVKVVMAHADNLIANGMIKIAIDAYNEVLKNLEPHSTTKDKGSLVARRDELKELLRIEAGLKKKDLPPLALVTTKRALAGVKLIQEDLEGARKLLTQADKILDELPDTTETVREAGMTFQVKAKLLIQEKSFPAAITLLENSIDLLKPNGIIEEIFESYRLLSRTYCDMDDYSRAREILEQCHSFIEENESDEHLIPYHHELGMIAFREGELDDAMQSLQEALSLAEQSLETSPDTQRIKLDMAHVLLAKEQSGEVKRLLEEIEPFYRELNDQITLAEVDNLKARI